MSTNNIRNNIITNQERTECVTIGRLAPDFTAVSTHGYISLSDYRGSWVVLFSQPAAFSPVATTELMGASMYYTEFQKRNVQMIALTTDNNFANLEWVYDIFKQTGISVPFPIISDNNKVISHLYGMANPDRTYEESVRDAFIISPAGKIMSILTLPNSCGRSGYELLRIIDSLQLTEQYKVHTPADWRPGDPLVVPPVHTYEDLIKRVESGNVGVYECPFWYLCYTNLNPQTIPETDTNTVTEPNIDTETIPNINAQDTITHN